MAVFPEKPGRTEDPARLARYIGYMVERLERQNEALTRRLTALERQIGHKTTNGEETAADEQV